MRKILTLLVAFALLDCASAQVRFATNVKLTSGVTALQVPALPFTQVGSDAVLKKGSTYLGLLANALATPRACWDGSQWVGSFSLWNTSSGTWSTLFSTSPDLVTWTSVSLRQPVGSNYILGNGGVGCPTGLTYTYYFAYETYPLGASNVSITVDGSDNLTTWTNTANLSTSTYASDARVILNPNTGNMEIWYTNFAAADTVEYQYSPDGVTWTDPGTQFNLSIYAGEPHRGYPPHGGINILTTDQATGGDPARFTQLLSSQSGNANTWNVVGTALAFSNVTIPGMTVLQCFDSAIVYANATHTGPGNIPFMLSACGDNVSGSDATDSDIVLSKWHN